jgi:hypothetical protein
MVCELKDYKPYYPTLSDNFKMLLNNWPKLVGFYESKKMKEETQEKLTLLRTVLTDNPKALDRNAWTKVVGIAAAMKHIGKLDQGSAALIITKQYRDLIPVWGSAWNALDNADPEDWNFVI